MGIIGISEEYWHLLERIRCFGAIASGLYAVSFCCNALVGVMRFCLLLSRLLHYIK